MQKVILLCIICGIMFGYGLGYDEEIEDSYNSNKYSYQYKSDSYGYKKEDEYYKNKYFDNRYENARDDLSKQKESEYKYEGLSGQKYKYDLSDPVDRLNYDMDIDSKMNDKIYAPVTPDVQMDRRMGQYGGGIKGFE